MRPTITTCLSALALPALVLVLQAIDTLSPAASVTVAVATGVLAGVLLLIRWGRIC